LKTGQLQWELQFFFQRAYCTFHNHSLTSFHQRNSISFIKMLFFRTAVISAIAISQGLWILINSFEGNSGSIALTCSDYLWFFGAFKAFFNVISYSISPNILQIFTRYATTNCMQVISHPDCYGGLGMYL
jgi:hypothetical protein